MVDWGVVLAIVSPISAIVVAWLAFGRNKRKDTQADSASMATMQSDIGYIKAGNDRINDQLKETNNQMVDMRERIVSVEASAKQAHHRLDRIEGKQDRG